MQVFIITVNGEIIGAYSTREFAERAAEDYADMLRLKRGTAVKFPWGYGFRIHQRELDASGWTPLGEVVPKKS